MIERLARLPIVHSAICWAQGRSGKWPAVRAAWLRVYSTCEACGGTKDLEVHHIVPFSQDKSKELDSTNFITLCNHLHCHLQFGHLCDFKAHNPSVKADAFRQLDRVRNRPYK